MTKDRVFFDLGTVNLRVFSSKSGIIFQGPNCIAYEEDDVRAFGTEAVEIGNRDERDLNVVFPVREGVIADHHSLIDLLNRVLETGHKKKWFSKPDLVFSVSPFLNDIEQRAVEFVADSIASSGVAILPEFLFLSAAKENFSVLSNQKTGESVENWDFFVQTGAGRVDISVISNLNLITGKKIPSGMQRIKEKVLKRIRTDYGVETGFNAIKEILLDKKVKDFELRGRDKVTGNPLKKMIKSSYIKKIMDYELERIYSGIREIFEKTPPDLTGELLEKGISFSGGPANQDWFVDLISEKIEPAINRPDDPGAQILKGFERVSELSRKDFERLTTAF